MTRSFALPLTLALTLGLALSATAEEKKKGTTVQVGGTKVEVSGDKVKVQGAGGAVDVDPDAVEAEAEEEATGAVDEVTGSGKDMFVVTGNARKLSHECKPNEKVSISGNSHTVTLTGPCKAVSVSGNSHSVTVDMAGAISVSGNMVKLAYKSGLDGKEPKITKSGNKCTVTKIKP